MNSLCYCHVSMRANNYGQGIQYTHPAKTTDRAKSGVVPSHYISSLQQGHLLDFFFFKVIPPLNHIYIYMAKGQNNPISILREKEYKLHNKGQVKSTLSYTLYRKSSLKTTTLKSTKWLVPKVIHYYNSV